MPGQVCDQCFSIKQKCDGINPCMRCNRLELECTYLRSKTKQRTEDQKGKYGVDCHRNKYRANVVRRDRTGCNTCKKRKKKCDEAKPKCADCRRLNLPCIRTLEAPLRHEVPPLQTTEAHEESNSPPATYSSSLSGVVPSPEDFKHFGTDISVSSLPDQLSTENKLALYHEEPVYQWLSDNTSHIFGNSISDFDVINDLNLRDGEPNVLNIDKVNLPNSPFDNNFQTPALSNWFPLDPMSIPYSLTLSPIDQLKSQQDKLLFQHYTHIVSRSLCITSSDDDNPFLKLMIPLASASSAVIGAILALSAVHLKHNGGYPEIIQRGLNHQTKALAALNDLIASRSSSNFFSEQSLATILLFCIIDIREGNSSRWSWHIAAAKTVITSADRSSDFSTPHTPSWSFLLDIFEYVDSIITISQCQPPLIDHEKLRPQNNNETSLLLSNNTSQQLANCHDYNAVFGVARPLFRLIGQISALSSRRKDRMKPFFDDKFRRSAAVIDCKLRTWTPPGSSPTTPQFSSASLSSCPVRDRDIKEAVHASMAIRWASILRLHQIVDGYALPHPVPTECLQHILDHLLHIRVGSAVESLMVFPLIMAGSVALSREERMTIRSRWLIIERTIGFGNIVKGGKLLEQVWKAMDEDISGDNGEPGKVTVNWASIRWHEYGTFVMF